MPSPALIRDLRSSLSAHTPCAEASAGQAFGTGAPPVDETIGGLARGAIHDVYAVTGPDAVAAQGFALGLAQRATTRSIVWIAQTRSRSEIGHLYGPGLVGLGLDPARLIYIDARTTRDLLAAGEEALGSGAVGAVILCGWGESREITLTTGRRLAMAAQRGGVTGFFMRAAARPTPSAAWTRWSIASALSRPLPAGAPGAMAFRAALTRSRSGIAPAEWLLEWDGDTQTFRSPAASGGLVSVPRHRQAGAANARAA